LTRLYRTRERSNRGLVEENRRSNLHSIYGIWKRRF